MNSILKIVLGVLVVAALVLGYMVYKKEAGIPRNAPTSQDSVKGTVTAASKEEMAFVFPGPKATQAEKSAFFQLVSKSAVETNKIDVSACSAKPFVVSIAENSAMTFVNKDSVDHVVSFNAALSYTVPAKSSFATKAAFGKGPGTYGYACDQTNGNAGIILVK